MKRSIAGTCIAAVLAAAALPASAQVEAGFFVNAVPPVPLVEVVPVPRVGFVWAPGYWDWRILDSFCYRTPAQSFSGTIFRGMLVSWS